MSGEFIPPHSTHRLVGYIPDEQKQVGDAVGSVAIEVRHFGIASVGRDLIVMTNEQKQVGNIGVVVVVGISCFQRRRKVRHVGIRCIHADILRQPLRAFDMNRIGVARNRGQRKSFFVSQIS